MQRTELSVNFSQQWKQRGPDLVARGTLIRQGVFCGSRGCILHPGESLRNSVQAWNRAPVTWGHPKIGDDFVAARDAPDTIIGHLESPAFQGNALKADIVISTRDPKIRQDLKSSREVSVGIFTDEIPSVGLYKEQEYTLISQNYKPDHLAIMRPGETGACSWESGCGIRTNQAQEILREAATNFFNNLTGKGEDQMKPLLPPEVYRNEEKKEDLQALQEAADKRGILLPTQFNRSIGATKTMRKWGTSINK